MLRKFHVSDHFMTSVDREVKKYVGIREVKKYVGIENFKKFASYIRAGTHHSNTNLLLASGIESCYTSTIDCVSVTCRIHTQI